MADTETFIINASAESAWTMVADDGVSTTVELRAGEAQFRACTAPPSDDEYYGHGLVLATPWVTSRRLYVRPMTNIAVVVVTAT